MDIKVLMVCIVISAAANGQTEGYTDTSTTKISTIDTVVLDQYNEYYIYEVESGDTVVVKNFLNNGQTGRSIYYLSGNVFVDYHVLTSTGITTDTIYGFYPNGKVRFRLFPNKINDYLLFGEWYYNDGSIQKIRKVFGTTVLTKAWYKNGKIESIFRDTSVDSFLLITKGKQERFYSDGKIKSVEVISEGVHPIVSYWPNGNIQQKGTIVNNPLSWVGVKKEYFENGRIEKIYRYLEGSSTETANIAHGWWEQYDAEGNFIKAKNYRNGRLIETLTSAEDFEKQRNR